MNRRTHAKWTIGLALALLAGSAGWSWGQTKWKSYVKEPGVTYTVSTTVAAKNDAPAAPEDATPVLARAATLAGALERLRAFNALCAGACGRVTPDAPAGAWTGRLRVLSDRPAWAGTVDLSYAPDAGYRLTLHRDDADGTDPGGGFQGPPPAPAGAPAWVLREEQSAAALAYGQGQRVFVAWAAPDESRWWVLAADPATGWVARLRQWSADADGEPVDEGLLEAADYDAEGSGPPVHLRELHAGRLVAELTLAPVELSTPMER